MRASVFVIAAVGSAAMPAIAVAADDPIATLMSDPASCVCGRPDKAGVAHGRCDASDGAGIACVCDPGYAPWRNANQVFYCLPACEGTRTSMSKCDVLPRTQRDPLKASSNGRRKPPPPAKPKISPCQADPRGDACLAIAEAAVGAQNWAVAADAYRGRCTAGVDLSCRAFAKLAPHLDLAAVGAEATLLLDAACRRGDIDSCLDLASAFTTGDLGKSDPFAKDGALDLACELGSAAFELGSYPAGAAQACLARGDATTDSFSAAKYYLRACHGRSAEGCERIAMYLYSRESNEAEALEYATVACDLDPKNCLVLGLQKALGKGTKEDRVAARKLFIGSCDHDIAFSCQLAALLDDKRSGEWYGKAADLYASSCDSGDIYECAELAELYAEGNASPTGTGSRSTRASDLLTSACDAGLPRACRERAFYAVDGAEGVARDPAAAEALFTRACHQGDDIACTWRAEKGERSRVALRGPTGDFLGVAVSRALRNQDGDDVPVLFMLAFGRGEYRDDKSLIAELRLQSSFSDYARIAVELRGGYNLVSSARADRSKTSLLNLGIGFQLGARWHGDDGRWFWLGGQVSEMAFFGCSVAAKVDVGYQWWGDGIHALDVSVGLLWWWDRHMTGVNHDNCRSRTLYGPRQFKADPR
jgi:TPR repeat protein